MEPMDINAKQFLAQIAAHRERLGVPDYIDYQGAYFVAALHPLAMRMRKDRLDRGLIWSHVTDRWWNPATQQINILTTLGEHRILGRDLWELWESVCFETVGFIQENAALRGPLDFERPLEIHRQSLGGAPDFRNYGFPVWEAAKQPLALRMRQKSGVERALSWSHLKDKCFDRDNGEIRLHFTLGLVTIKGIALAYLYETIERQTALFIQEMDESKVRPVDGVPFITSITWPEKRKLASFSGAVDRVMEGGPYIHSIEWPLEVGHM